MRIRYLAMIAAVLGLAVGCAKKETPECVGCVWVLVSESGVRQFVAQVGQDVTREGPLAWKKEFADEPEFFMASGGKLAFANGQAAMKAIEGLPQKIKHIELHWGDDLRIDVLTLNLAMAGTSYEEARESAEGLRIKERG